MSMTVASSDDADPDGEVMSAINTTPLVDIMLVLLIIFLITIPAVLEQVPVELPKTVNQPSETKPENIVIAVDANGQIYWNNKPIANDQEMLNRLVPVATTVPQPEIHIRGDGGARFQDVGRVIFMIQQARIAKIGFIHEPPPRG